VATQKAVEASDAASAAQISANLAAGMSINANLMPNGGGEKGTEGWSSTHPGFYTMDWPLYGGRIFKQEVVGTVPLSYIRGPDTAALPGMQITLSWRGWVEHFTGTAEVYIVFWNAAGGWVGETPRIPLNASTRKVTGTGPAGTATASMAIAFAGTGGAGGALVFARTKFEEGPDATAYTAERTDTDVQAQLAITAAVAADSQSRLGSVSFNVTGGAGGDPFDVSLKAGPDGSDASITATKVRLRNVVNNQVIDALIVEGGKARFGSNVEIAGNLVVAGSIDTAQLKTGAVSKGASAASTASTSVGLNTWTDLLSVAMTTAGGEVSIDFGAQVSVVNSQGPNAVVEVRFMRGSTVLETMQIMDVLGAQTIYVQGSMDPFQTYVQINSVVSTYIHPFTVDTGAPAGSHTWKVQMRSQAGATVGAKKMRLQEMKR